MAHTRTAPSVAARSDRFFMFSWGSFVPWAVALLMVLTAGQARAQEDPPGRVGRLASVQGAVWWFDHEVGQWSEADRNRPLTTGDRVSTGANGRAELRVGSSVLRLAPATELEVLRLDDERMAWQLHTGSLALRLRSRETALETDIVTGEVRLQPDRAGHYRLDRSDDTTVAGVWRGGLRAQEPGSSFTIEAGQRVELWREPLSGRGRDGARWNADSSTLRKRSSRFVDDEFAAWVIAEERQDERSTAYRYVSPEMTGAEELDRNGRWEQHPEYGAMWIPVVTVADWAPYRHGRWAWVQPWGWTWVDDARWGFAPFHYGRWVNWRGRWGWCPGSYEARPVFAPALVAWVGGPRLGLSISIGLPAVAWVPLAPRERFVPHYRHTPVYERRVNVQPYLPGTPPRHGATLPGPAPHVGVVVYSNQGVPGAVTVVPRDVLLQRQPVARAAVDQRPGPQRPEARGAVAAWEAVAPPAAERPQRPGFERDDRRPGPPRPEERRNDREERDQRDQRDRADRRDPNQPQPRQSQPQPQPQPQPQQAQPQAQPQPQQPPRAAPAPVAPAVVAPAAEPQAPRNEGRRRDPREGERRGADMPAWSDGPQRPAAPARPTPAPDAKPAITPAPAAPPLVMGPQRPPTAAPVAAPAPAMAGPPAAAARGDKPAAERPPADKAPADKAQSDKPRRDERTDADESRKRTPNNRERENLR